MEDADVASRGAAAGQVFDRPLGLLNGWTTHISSMR